MQFGQATTTTINITGATGVGAFDQDFYIEMTQTTAPGGALNTTLEDWGTINWVVNGGNNTAAGDSLFVDNSGATDRAARPGRWRQRTRPEQRW